MTRDIRYVDVGALTEPTRFWWVTYVAERTGLRFAVRRIGSQRLWGDWRWAKDGRPEAVSAERPENVDLWVERMPYEGRWKKEDREKFELGARALWGSGLGIRGIGLAYGMSKKAVERLVAGGDGYVLAKHVRRGRSVPNTEYRRVKRSRDQVWDMVRERFGR